MTKTMVWEETLENTELTLFFKIKTELLLEVMNMV